MKRLFILLALLQLAACGSVPKDHFYVLSMAENQSVALAPAKYTVAIGAVGVPEIVDRQQMVLYQGNSRVEILEHERWAQPLRAAIPAAIAHELRLQLPEARVATYPQAAAADANCRINLDVQRFESRLGESVLVEALWSVRCGQGKIQQGRSFVRESVQGDSYAALVDGYGRGLAQIGKELAQVVRNTIVSN